MEQRSASKPIKIPGTDHPITIERHPTRVMVMVAGRIIADTRDALILREAKYPAVFYIPRKDVDMTLLERTDHATIVLTRETAPISAFHSVARAQKMPRGHTRLHIRPSCPSRIISPSTPTVSTRSTSNWEVEDAGCAL